MRILGLVILFFAILPQAISQQSLFQTTNGQTSLYLTQGTASVNLGDSKASLGFFDRVNTRKFFWGGEGFATANSGFVTLVSSDKPKAPEGGGDISVGRHNIGISPPPAGTPFRPYRENWALIDLGYSRSSFTLFPTGTIPSADTHKTNFDRFRSILAYNHFYGGSMIWGIAGGAERRNNLSDLKSVNAQTVVLPTPSGDQTSIVKTQSGYYGDYKTYVAAPIYEDFLLYPGESKVPGTNNRIALDFLTRSDIASSHRATLGGIGLFIFKENAEETPLGGIVATYDGSKFQVSLTAGFTLSK